MPLARKVADFDDFRKITFNWTPFLSSLGSGITISASVWEDDSSLVALSSPTNDTTSTTVRANFGGGSPISPPYLARISNTITTSSGEIKKESIVVSVSER